MQNDSEDNQENAPVTVDIIEKCIGALGKWQTWILSLIFFLKFPVIWVQLSIVFLAPTIDFRCDDSTNEKCAKNCSNHIFDTSTFTKTITTEWDLVCEKQHLSTLAQTVLMSGVLCGSFVFGYLSDRFGRRNPLVISLILQAASGLATAFCPWLVMFLVLRFFSGAAVGGTLVTSFVMVMEVVGTEWRTLAGIFYQIPASLGHLCLTVISYFLRDWRYLQMTIAVPSVVLIFSYWVLPESPRWQLVAGKKQMAINTLKKAAKYNKKSVVNIEGDVSVFMQKNCNNSSQRKGNVLDLVRTPVMRSYTIIMCFSWTVVSLCYFGMSQFMGQLGGDFFLNVGLSAVVQLPGVLLAWPMGKTFGRKLTLVVSNITIGVALLLMTCVPEDPVWIKTSLALIGILAASLCFTLVYIYAGELFPTVVRNVGVGACSTCARVGSMIAPFVADLGGIQSWIPPVIFGVMPLIVAGLCVRLPETLDCKLPDTVEEVEEFHKTRDILNNTELNENLKQGTNFSSKY